MARAVVHAVFAATAFALAGCAAAPGEAPARAAPSIPIEVLRPPGAGPFPAVVLLHDCSGLGPRSSGSPRRWAQKLLARGFVVALPDSFSPRGFPDGVCTAPPESRAVVGPMRRARDAYDTLDHLRALPYVQQDRIAVMGGSHGGATTIAVLAASGPMAARSAGGFRGGVALYPGCAIGNPRYDRAYRPVAPLLILAGELDDWTPAKPCVDLATAAGGEPGGVRIKVYPGAHHSFDNDRPVRFVGARSNANAPGGRGATTGGNAAAWADSIREVEAFMARHLGP